MGHAPKNRLLQQRAPPASLPAEHRPASLPAERRPLPIAGLPGARQPLPVAGPPRLFFRWERGWIRAALVFSFRLPRRRRRQGPSSSSSTRGEQQHRRSAIFSFLNDAGAPPSSRGEGLPTGSGGRWRGPRIRRCGCGGGWRWAQRGRQPELGAVSMAGSTRWRSGGRRPAAVLEPAVPYPDASLLWAHHYRFASALFEDVELPSDLPSAQNGYLVWLLCWKGFLVPKTLCITHI